MKSGFDTTRRTLFVVALLALLAIGATSRAGAEDAGTTWYGPDSVGCYDEWNGAQWTGFVYCPNGSGIAWAGWYGPYADGCAYEWDGANWTSGRACLIDGITYIFQAPVSNAPQVTTNADGSQTILSADGTLITVPADDGPCGNYCQPNYGGYGTNAGDAGIWTQPETQPAYTPGCEFVREGYCYSTYS